MVSKFVGLKTLMSQVFDDTGKVVPVTVIDLNNVKVAKKSSDFSVIGHGKEKKSNKADLGNFKDLGFVPEHKLTVSTEQIGELNVGDECNYDQFDGVTYVNVTAISRGRGFAGTVKRYGFAGGPKTHGQSDRNRAPGSIGAGTTPGRVLKGKRMAGRMGGKTVTVTNLKVVKFDKESKLMFVKGAVPGNNGSLVIISFEK